jgi:ABC-type branched-subunit amino acid transport system substrate-binding protein
MFAMNLRALVVAALSVAAVSVVVATNGSAKTTSIKGTMHVLMPTKAEMAKAKLPTVEIGQIDSLTGVGAPQLSAQYSVLVATARALNRSGGLHGHPIGVFICDDHTDTAGAADCARQMVSKGVVAVIGGESVNGDAQVQPILQQANIAQVGILAISAQQASGSNVFLFNPSNPYFTAQEVAYGYYHGDKPFAGIINDTGTAGRAFEALVTPLVNQFTQYNPELFIAPTVADFSSAGASIAASGAKGVSIAVGIARGFQMIRAIQPIAPNVQHYYFPGSVSTSAMAAAGIPFTSIIQTSLTPPFTDPSMQSFVKTMAAEEKRGDKAVDLTRLAPRDVYPYVGLESLVAVTKGMTSFTPDSVLNAYVKAKNVVVGPYMPPWTPNAPGPADAPRSASTSVYYIGYQKNGKAILLVPHAVSFANAAKGKF